MKACSRNLVCVYFKKRIVTFVASFGISILLWRNKYVMFIVLIRFCDIYSLLSLQIEEIYAIFV